MQPLKPMETELDEVDEEDPDDLEAMVRREERRQEEYFRQNPDGTQEDYDLFKSLCELADVDIPEGEKKSPFLTRPSSSWISRRRSQRS